MLYRNTRFGEQETDEFAQQACLGSFRAAPMHRIAGVTYTVSERSKSEYYEGLDPLLNSGVVLLIRRTLPARSCARYCCRTIRVSGSAWR